jgi:hypothetical protein
MPPRLPFPTPGSSLPREAHTGDFLIRAFRARRVRAGAPAPKSLRIPLFGARRGPGNGPRLYTPLYTAREKDSLTGRRYCLKARTSAGLRTVSLALARLETALRRFRELFGPIRRAAADKAGG